MELRCNIKKRRSEAISLRDHGFITTEMLQRLYTKINDYYNPSIEAIREQQKIH